MKQTASSVCSDCLDWEKTSYQTVLEKNVSLYSYEPFMQDYIARWKYRGDYVLGKVFEAEFRKLYLQHFQDSKYEVVPIPLSAERMAERGFNQAGELAFFTRAKQKLVLGRKHAEKQSKRSRLHRLTADNPFYLLAKPPKYAVLIDDIYTTGTTLRHAAQVLKENDTDFVAACTLIRG
ncbi:ComF family protein [Terribacillus saccharophilus]|uniref:ComF family protein n=1 Tax=Terribacillus saccharophilus TaxID=361277 RepID=UPI003982A8EC